MSTPLYLDNAATTPVDPAVIAAMTACLGLEGDFGNAASGHAAGRRARALVEQAREEIAARVGAPAHNLLFTSGATEANNLALKGAVRAHAGARKHLLTTCIEHPSVTGSARALATEGVDVTFLPCDAEGIVAPEQVREALDDSTVLVSVMHVNNEIGVVQDIAAIAEICRARGVLLHVDAAQGAGKVAVDLAGWGVDLCSLTAHKINGPKGIGALYVRDGVRLAPLIHGGDPELGVRGGTLATHQIVGMGRAYGLADPAVEGPRLAALRDQLWAGLRRIDGAVRNGCARRAAPHILNVTFPGVDGTSLLLALDDIALSQGSACASSVAEPSHVLSAIGLSDARAQSTLRFGVGRFTSAADIDRAVARVRDEHARLASLARSAPAWCSR